MAGILFKTATDRRSASFSKAASSDGDFSDDGGSGGSVVSSDPDNASARFQKEFSGSLLNSFRKQRRDWPKTRTKTKTKCAAAPGGPTGSEIERSMQMIAETYILDKAPHLSEYMLGFQLLKKNDDDTKAAGIFAYKVGEELVYIPVFAINGDIQGHELMYLVSKDQFVPSDEKWVNYLLSRKPQEPGVPESRNRGDIPSYGLNLTHKIEHFPIVVEGVEFL